MKNLCEAVSEDLQQNWQFKISQDSTGGQIHRIIDEVLKKL